MEEGKEYTIQDFCNLLNLKPSRTKELLKALTQDIEQIGNNKNRKYSLYLIMINVITFALYGLDKWRAMTRQWRVREKKLIILALIGGSIGAMIGMTVFHHKTRKWYFRLGIPLILGIQVSLILCFYDMM